jgi:meso-butanediol dehydrogenase / (S,S)-butanediol dehydrogenase / diacetyl reductase
VASEGARVVLAGRTYSKVEATVDTIRARGGDGRAVRCDVGNERYIVECVNAAVQAFGTIDILVNNAQEVPLGRLEDVSRDEFEAFLR